MATTVQAQPHRQQQGLKGEPAHMSSAKSHSLAENMFREEHTPQSNGGGLDDAQHRLQSLSLDAAHHHHHAQQPQQQQHGNGHQQLQPQQQQHHHFAPPGTASSSGTGNAAGSRLGLPFIPPAMSPGPQLSTHPIFLASPAGTPDPYLMQSYPLFSRPLTPLYPQNLVPPTPGVTAFGGHTFMHPLAHAPSPAPYPFPLTPAAGMHGGPAAGIPATPQGPVPTFFTLPLTPMAGATTSAQLPAVGMPTSMMHQHAPSAAAMAPVSHHQTHGQVPDSALPTQPVSVRPNSNGSTSNRTDTPTPTTAPRPVRPQSTQPGEKLNHLQMLKKATGEDDDDEEDPSTPTTAPAAAANGTSSVMATPMMTKPTIVISPPSESSAAAAAASTAAAVASSVLPATSTAAALGQLTPMGDMNHEYLMRLYSASPTPPPFLPYAPSPLFMNHPSLDMMPPTPGAYLPHPHAFQFGRDHLPPMSPQHAHGSGIPQSPRHGHGGGVGAPPTLGRPMSYPSAGTMLPPLTPTPHAHGSRHGGHFQHFAHHGPISPVNKQPPRMETAAASTPTGVPEMPHLAPSSRSLPPHNAYSPRASSRKPIHGHPAHQRVVAGDLYDAHHRQSPQRSLGRTKGRYDERPALRSPRSYPNLSDWAPRNQYASAAAGDERSDGSEYAPVRGVRSPGSTHSHRSLRHEARSPRAGGGRPRGNTFSHYEPADNGGSPHVHQRKAPMSPRGGGAGGHYGTRSRAVSMNGAGMSSRTGGGAQGYTPNAINGVTAKGVTLVNGVPLTAQNFMEQARIETGSRSLQTLVERNPEVFRLVFTQMLECFWILSKDFFGNYLCQKLLECCNEADFTRLITSFAPRLEECCYDHKGSRVVVKVIELTKTKEQRAIVLGAMKPNLLNLMRDQYGCHVVKLLLHKFPLEELDFLFKTVHENCRDLGEVQFGLCVLKESFQKVISLLELKAKPDEDGEKDTVIEEKESAASSVANGTASLTRKERELVTSKDPDAVIEREIKKLFKPSKYGLQHYLRFVSEITTSALSFVNNSFGNYILQELIEKSAPQVRSLLLLRLHQKFRGSYCALAVKKCASNVVETFLRTRMEYVNRAICTELLNAVNFGKIVRDKFGNYVVQVALDTASNDQKRLLCKKITDFLNENRLPNHQSRIKWEKKLRNVQAYLEDPSVRLIARQPKKKVYRSTAK